MPVLRIKDFSGGLSTKISQNRIADNESPSLRNCRFTLKGALSKKPGSSTFTIKRGSGASMGVLRSAFSYQLTGMANEQILFADNNNIVRTTDLVSFTDVFTGMTDTDSGVEMLSFRGKVYIQNGTDTVRSIDSSNATSTVAAYPICNLHIVHKNRIFTASQVSPANRSRLFWSDVNNAESWQSYNFEDIYADDGTAIIGLASYGEELIVFKGPFNTSQSFNQSSMFRVLGNEFDATNPTYFIERIPMLPNVGALGHRTSKIINGVLVFMTNDGPFAYYGGGRQPQRIGEQLRGNFKTWQTGQIHVPRKRPCSTVFQNRYYCSLYDSSASSEDYNNRTYVWDDGKWYLDIPDSGSDDYQSGSTSSGTDFFIFQSDLYSISGGTNIARTLNTSAFQDNSDGGTSRNVNLRYLTKEFDLEDEVLFNDCYLHFKRQSSGTLTLETNVNQRGVSSVSVDMTTPDIGNTENNSSNILRKKINIGKRGRTIQFGLYDRGNNDIEIYEIELHFAKTQFTRDSYS